MMKRLMYLPRQLGPLGWVMIAAIIVLALIYVWCLYCILGTC